MGSINKTYISGYRKCLIPALILLLWVNLTTYAQLNPADEPHRLGKTVFQEKGCIQCHAIDGEGGNRGPDLQDHKFYGTNLDLASTMWNHSPKMYKKMKRAGLEYPEFTETQISQLVSFLAFARYKGDPGNPFRGRKLLKSKHCTTCHKFGGEGGDIGPDIGSMEEFISPLKLVEAMWNHGPDMMQTFEDSDIERPMFYKDDIVHIAAAIQSFIRPSKIPIGSYDTGNPQAGSELIKTKGCIQCHSLSGTGASIAPDFKDIDFNYSVLMVAGMMWNHGPKMWTEMEKQNLAIPEFKSGEMADIIAFLYSLGLQDEPGKAELGEELVNKKNCLTCHSSSNKDPDIKEFAAMKGFNSSYAMIATMWNHVPAMEKKRKAEKVSWPKLDGTDMANLYAYINSLTDSQVNE
ncbi:c-type cytochrome [bacterium]|nr:c-type cytochrome [bacterium]